MVNVERKKREKMTTTKQQQPPIEVKFKKTKKNHRNSNRKMRSAGDRECFWK